MKIAVVQTAWQPEASHNLEHVLQRLEQSCKGRTLDLVCLPEFFLGPAWYMPGQGALQGVTDTPVPGPLYERLGEWARRHRVYLLCGSVVERMDDGRYCNTAVLLGRDGEMVGRAHKIHPFANEAVSCQGGSSICALDTEFGKIGIAVCSDFWVPETLRLLTLQGAHTLFVPGGSLRQNLPAMVNALVSAAYLNVCNLVYCSPVGRLVGMRGGQTITVEFAGTSLVAAPQGLLVQAPPDVETALYAQLQTEAVLELRQPSTEHEYWQGVSLRAPQAYGALLQDYVGLTRDLRAEIAQRMRQTTPASGTPTS
ncbi:carbon-nitrogen hydrolase family protein [Roseateles sp. BYS180W]|uniref:Carbon-nitrogen hydrolase family protein n=1 Tax=Roseateles rivi TaxID=3299028 RepID=A0ABW7FTX3_9BURK